MLIKPSVVLKSYLATAMSLEFSGLQQDRREVQKRLVAQLEEAGRVADAATETLMNTPPTTLAGMRAITQYLVEWDNNSGYYYLPMVLPSPILAA